MTDETKPSKPDELEARLKRIENNVFALAQMSQSQGQKNRTDREVLESIEARINSLGTQVGELAAEVKKISPAPSP